MLCSIAFLPGILTHDPIVSRRRWRCSPAAHCMEASWHALGETFSSASTSPPAWNRKDVHTEAISLK